MAGEPRMVFNVHGDGATREAVARLLVGEGLRCRDVASAAEAQEALLRPDFDGAGDALILLDAALDGAEPLCRALRDRGEGLPPLLLTRPAGAGPAPGLEALADDVLERPPDPARWAPAIRAWARIGARLAVRRSEAVRWRTIFDAMDEGVAMVGADGVIRVANAALAALVGVEPGSLLGARLVERAERLRPPDRPWPVERTLRAGTRSRGEWEAGRRWLRSTAAPLRDGSGALAGAVATLEDVTAEVHLRQRVAWAEAEAGARAERIEQLERDARLYQALAGLGPRSGAPEAARPALSRALPEFFCDAVEDYGRVLDLRLRRRGYAIEGGGDGSAELTALAERLGDAGAGPRDVVELHALALRHRSTGSRAARARAYGEEAQVAILELMGRLVEHYRAGRDAPARPPAPSE